MDDVREEGEKSGLDSDADDEGYWNSVRVAQCLLNFLRSSRPFYTIDMRWKMTFML